MGEGPRQDTPGGPITLGGLFVCFLTISMLGFGGPIVWARRILVERYRWLDDRELAEIVGLCQFLPGPNMVCITVCVGLKFRGWAGALAGLAGFIMIPWTLAFTLGSLYLQYAEIGAVQGMLRGVAAVAAGLIIATGLRLLRPYRARPAALLFAALAFTGLALLRLPLLLVIVLLVPASSLIARRASPAAL